MQLHGKEMVQQKHEGDYLKTYSATCKRYFKNR